MNPVLRWLTTPEWAHTVTALLHSLWQGALVALVLAVLLRRQANPLTRYRCALSALAIIVIAGLITWGILNAPTTAPNPISPVANDSVATPVTVGAFAPSPANRVVFVAPLTQPTAPTNWTTWLALLWMTGAMVMLLRAGIKVAGAEKLRRSCQPLADENIAALVAEACRAVGLARKIRVAVTDKLTSPAVVGVIVPTLILPLSLFTTLTPPQIQFVLLHELAHIRRDDYLANLFQLFAEALLFFNPAVWWISHQIRREREACCDALAIELSGAPADYARTLVRVAENILQPAPAAAPAFGDDGREPSSLADRVQRLVVPGYRPALRLTWRAMATSLIVGIALLVLSAIGTRNTVGAILSSNQITTNNPPQMLASSLAGTSETEREARFGVSATNLTQSEAMTPELIARDYGYRLDLATTNPTKNTLARPAPSPIEIRGGSVIADANTGISTVTNGGHAKFASYELTADLILVNNRTSEVLARGNVRLETTSGILSGENLRVSLADTDPKFEWLNPPTKVNKVNSASVATNSFNRLNEIRLEKVYFDRQPLREVARELSEQTKANDPADEGVKFVLDPDHQSIDPSTGLPWASVSEELNSVLVTSRYRISGPLSSILNSIVSCADKPIKYTFTNNIVRFSLRGANESEPFFTREFTLPARTLYGKILTNLTQAEINRTASSNLAPMALEGFRTWLKGIGVNMDPQQGKSLFYKDRKGILLARATLAELDAIEAAIVNLNAPSKIVLANRTYQLEPTTVIQAIEAHIPQFKLSATTNVTAGLLALLESSGVDLSLPKTFYYNDRTGGLFVRATPEDLDAIESLLHVIGQQPPQVNIKAVFVEIPFGKAQPKELAKILEPIAPESGITFTGILTASQFKAVLRALEKSSSAKFLAMPQVTTLSGRQAQIQVKDMKTIVSGMTAVVTNGMTNLVYQSEAMSFGPVLELLPTVSNDGYTVQMTLTPTFTEFLGYEDPKKLKPSLPAGLATLPLPIIRTRQMTTSANVWDGQTIVLGNFSDQMLDTPPDLKGAPKASGKKQSKQLLVFITPTIIDPAGNPANKDMGIPSRR